MSYEDSNCDSLANLSILDPPRWGWSAAGGITDLTPPHERARRSRARREYINAQTREKKRLAREKENAAKASSATADKDEHAKHTVTPATAPSVSNPTVAALTKVSTGLNAAGAMENAANVQNIASGGIQLGNTIQNAPVANVLSINAIGNANTNISALISAENNSNVPAKGPNLQMVQPPVSIIANVSAAGENLKSSAHPKPAAVQSQSQASTNKAFKHNPKNNTRTKYEFGPNYNVINKPKGRSKRDRFDIEIKTIQEDGSVHPGAYHRGIISEEPRFKGRGYLLCDTNPTDTTHGWDEPDLKLKVNIEFPLCDPDCSDDEDNDARNSEGTKHAPRRNARRGEGKRFISETERRKNREEKLAELPHFRDTVEWDLSNPRTPTPMVYAADIAAQFGLSFCRTLDLARLIQKQIDDFVKESVNYHVPISSKDHMLLPREKHSLQPPKYSNPKLLHGGHCASNVTTILKPFEVREVKKDRVASFDDTKSSGKKSGVARPARPAIVKTVQFEYQVAKPEELPKHDVSKLGLDPIYLDEFLRRAQEENQKVTKLLADGNIGTTKVVMNDTCHFCHIRRPQLVQFSCGNSAHCFCDLHTCRRLGFRVEQAASIGYNWCPVCTLQCTCYRCHTRVEVLLPQFAKECKKQGLGPTEVKYDFVFNCSRHLARLAKDTLKKVTTGSTTSRRKSNVKAAPTVNHGDIVTVKVPKIPKEDFPAEMSASINKDPSLKDDYITIFTPQGTVICEEAAKKAREEKPAVKPVAAIDDGNVDYCGECQKTGDLICCDRCPRGFHGKCMGIDAEAISGHWECPGCLQDSTGQDGNAMKGILHHDKLLAVFKDFHETRDFNAKVRILSKIFDMIKFLIDYDFGSIFSEAVNVKLVRDYKVYVKRPMDLGTITSNLLKGAYCKVSSRTKDLVGADNVTEMDIIIFNVLKDIEQIWHNSFLYNREGSSFYRMGQVLRRKCSVVQKISYQSDLDPFVMENVVLFVDECKVKRMELSNSLNPWIPASKYQISIPSRGPSKAKTIIGIFDEDTNMIIKQYSSVAGSFIVAEFLSKLGHKSEVKTGNKQKFRDYIRAMQAESSLTLFGYRWLYIDNVRSGNFTLAPKGLAIIQKQCKISKAVLEKYNTIEDAHKSWLYALSKCVGIADSQGADRSVEYFQRCYLDGESSLDAQDWVRVKKEKCTSLEGVSQSDLNTSITLNANEAKPNENASQKAGAAALTDAHTTEPLRGLATALDQSNSNITTGAPANEPNTSSSPFNAQALLNVGRVGTGIIASVAINVSGRVGVIHNQVSSTVPGAGLISQTTMEVNGQRSQPEGAIEVTLDQAAHVNTSTIGVTKGQDTHINQNSAETRTPSPAHGTMNYTSGNFIVHGDDVLSNTTTSQAVVDVQASKVELSASNNIIAMNKTYGNSNGEDLSIQIAQNQESFLRERIEVNHIREPVPSISTANNISTNDVVGGREKYMAHTTVKKQSIQTALPSHYNGAKLQPLEKLEGKIQIIPNAPPLKIFEAVEAIEQSKVQNIPLMSETVGKHDNSSNYASHMYMNETKSQKELPQKINEVRGASGIEPPKHGFSLISNNADSAVGTGTPNFQSTLAKTDIRHLSALEVATATSLLDFAMSVGSPASSSIATSPKKRSSNGEEVRENKKYRHH